jgi:ribosomal RNA-processing protein 9
MARQYDFTLTSSLRCRGHRFSVTSAVASEDAQYLYTSGKEGHIIKWSLQSGRKIATFYKQRVAKGKEKALPQDVQGHTDEILSLAVSSDGRYLASGSKDRRVGVWDVEKDEWVKGFGGHKDSISVCMFYMHDVHNADNCNVCTYSISRALHFEKAHSNCIPAHLIGLSSYSTSQQWDT